MFEVGYLVLQRHFPLEVGMVCFNLVWLGWCWDMFSTTINQQALTLRNISACSLHFASGSCGSVETLLYSEEKLYVCDNFLSVAKHKQLSGDVSTAEER